MSQLISREKRLGQVSLFKDFTSEEIESAMIDCIKCKKKITPNRMGLCKACRPVCANCKRQCRPNSQGETVCTLCRRASIETREKRRKPSC